MALTAAPAGTSPQRIQRQRTRGWRKPPGSIHVAAPSNFENPFRHLERRDLALRLFRALYDDAAFAALPPDERKLFLAYGDWNEWEVGGEIWHRLRGYRRESLARLRGHDLSCWCPLDQPCHADILLELANAPSEAGEAVG